MATNHSELPKRYRGIDIQIENTILTPWQWSTLGSRDELRAVAKRHKIKRGQDKIDTATYLSRGVPEGWMFRSDEVPPEEQIKFRVRLVID